MNDEGTPGVFALAAAALKENPDVLLASNINHLQALDALDVVAAALRDITFAAAKARLLFPPPPPPTDDIVVRGTLDWVLFHRRRDKQCSAVVEIPPLKAPETYRIFNITAPTLGRARSIAAGIVAQLADPPKFADRIKELSESALVDLVIRFAGDSSQPLFDFTEADTQWQRLKPGKLIANVFYGSTHDDNVALQTIRLRQFESAIANDSQEDASTVLKRWYRSRQKRYRRTPTGSCCSSQLRICAMRCWYTASGTGWEDRANTFSMRKARSVRWSFAIMWRTAMR